MLNSKFSRNKITQINKQYHNNIAVAYGSLQELFHPKIKSLYQDFFKKVFRYFEEEGKTRLDILDVGCGTGQMEAYLNPAKNRIFGIDVSDKMLSIAKNKYPNVKFTKADIYNFKTHKKYDVVVGNAILHHLKDFDICINKMMACLKPKGVLFLGAEPNYYSYHFLSLIKYFFRKILPDKRELKRKSINKKNEQIVEYHMNFSDGINPYQLKKIFLNRGFSRVEVKFSSREFFGGIMDRTHLPLINFLPNFLMDSTGILSRIFYLTAFK